jgi:hypothetical protein
MDNEPLFLESQHFRQIWLWIILMGTDSLFIIIAAKRLFSDHQVMEKSMSVSGLLILTTTLLLIAIMFYIMNLDTIIREDGIYVRFYPFQLKYKCYQWNKLDQCFVRKYNPIREFGGWGIRGYGKNRAVNVSGNNGIQIRTIEGYRLLVGTNKANEASTVLQKTGHWKT